MSDREKQMLSLMCGIPKKHKAKQNKWINKQNYREQNSGYQREGVEENEMGKGEHL